MRRPPGLVAACVAVAFAIATAPGRACAEPHDLVGRLIVLRPRQVEVEVTAEVNLASGELARPLSFAPDAWWGASRRWTVGLVHGSRSVDRIAPGASICVRQDGLLCDHAYRGGGADVRYLVRDGALAVAPRVRVLVRDIDPWKPAVTLGALARWTRGRFAIASDPYLQLGLANRDRGNRAQLFVPLRFAVQPTCRWMIALDTGWNGELAVIRDGWHVPVAVGVRARATAHVDVAAAVGFFTLLGPQNTPKERSAFFTVGWRS